MIVAALIGALFLEVRSYKSEPENEEREISISARVFDT
jgi:hypothetical protein